MDKRYELQDKFELIMMNKVENPENVEDSVYFQPDESVKLTYPCILYSLSRLYTRYGDDMPYIGKDQYTVTVIDRNPDSKIAKEIIQKFRYASFDRRYVADNLYHDVIRLYY